MIGTANTSIFKIREWEALKDKRYKIKNWNFFELNFDCKLNVKFNIVPYLYNFSIFLFKIKIMPYLLFLHAIFKYRDT